MGYSSSQPATADLPVKGESAPFLGRDKKRATGWLLIETVLVTVAGTLALRFLRAGSALSHGWFVAPGVLLAAALIPTVVARRKFARIIVGVKQLRYSLLLVGGVCVVAFAALLFVSWLLKVYGAELPLQPVVPRGRQWISWLLYQFLYVAVAEEVFFRGYVQGNILALADRLKDRQEELCKFASIVLSAACFALVHIVVQGQIASGLTFLPGLILGWLFLRTKLLLAPILFHALANTSYVIVFGVWASI